MYSYDTLGYGSNLSVWLTWTLLDGIACCTASQSSTDMFASTAWLNYPPPSLTPNSLYLNSTSPPVDNLTHSSVYIPRTGDSYFVTFSGNNFGRFPDVVSISYATDLNAVFYSCVTTPTTFSSIEGRITNTQITCRTATSEPVGTYFFLVDVAGQASDLGVDELIFPSVPEVHQVSGCELQDANGTYNCRTMGHELISISGTNLVSGMVGVTISLFLSFSLSLYIYLYT